MLTLLIICGALLTIYIVLGLTDLYKCKSSANLRGKTVIVTGENTGIRKGTALELAKRGARVILACRDRAKAEIAVNYIKQASGSIQVVYMYLDLASVQSVCCFVENFLKTEPRLDMLINHTGKYKKGVTFGLNHIGHYLLTVLLERLKESGPSQEVTVASLCYKVRNSYFDYISAHRDLRQRNLLLDVFVVYSQSELCNILFTHELTKRLKGPNVTYYSIHPGPVKLDITRHTLLWLKIIFKPISMQFFSSTESGSQTSLHCALQGGSKHPFGFYFSRCEVENVDPKARDNTIAKKLWEVSERLWPSLTH